MSPKQTQVLFHNRVIFGLKIRTFIVAISGSVVVALGGGLYNMMTSFKADYENIKTLVPLVKMHTEFIEKQKETNNSVNTNFQLIQQGQMNMNEDIHNLQVDQKQGFETIVKLMMGLKEIKK